MNSLVNILATRPNPIKPFEQDAYGPGLQDVSVPDALTVYGGAQLAGVGKDALLEALSPEGILRNENGFIRPWMSSARKSMESSGMSENSMLKGLIDQIPNDKDSAVQFLRRVRENYPTPVGDKAMKYIVSKFGY